LHPLRLATAAAAARTATTTTVRTNIAGALRDRCVRRLARIVFLDEAFAITGSLVAIGVLAPAVAKRLEYL
jgi:hypothetical protein